MIKRLKFYKEDTNRWYVDLPEWIGNKDDLEMVMGADDMLEIMSEGNKHVYITFYTEPNEYSDTLEFVRNATELENGAFYLLKTFRGVKFNLNIWLCDVTLFVFGEFPKVLYISSSLNYI